MPITKEIPINHNMLQWARREARLSPIGAALRARISAVKARGKTAGMTSSERLEQWEEGFVSPTYPQLVNLAKAYRRPILTFFVSEPPKKETNLLDFRTMSNKEPTILDHEIEMSALTRQIAATQKSVKELLLELGQETLPFVESVSLKTEPTEVADSIREVLGYDPEGKHGTSSEKLFLELRKKAESKGIFVLVQGNLGSHHTNLEPDVFRGFTISDKLAPFVVINPHDTQAAKLFTLIHELCHIWLGDSGISNLNSLHIGETGRKSQVENFCDQVSAEFLVPEIDLIKKWEFFKIGYEGEDMIKRIALHFRVSTIVMARRLVDTGLISRDYYWDWYDQYLAKWEEIKNFIKKNKKHPEMKIRIKSRLGSGLINTVLTATSKGVISEYDAAHILKVKVGYLVDIG